MAKVKTHKHNYNHFAKFTIEDYIKYTSIKFIVRKHLAKDFFALRQESSLKSYNKKNIILYRSVLLDMI